MKNWIFRSIALAALLIVSVFAVGCDEICNECGFAPNSQQLSQYINSDGALVTIAFWSDSNGCVTYSGCQGLP